MTPALLPAQGRQRDGTRQSDPPPYRPPPGRANGGYGAPPPPPPQPAPRHTNATDPPRGVQPPQGVQAEGTEKGPHTRTPAPTTRGSRTPTARPVGGQSGEGERLTPDAPRNSRRHPPWGRPTATPTTPSQVGGNRDRTAPPQARQTEQGTGAGHAICAIDDLMYDADEIDLFFRYRRFWTFENMRRSVPSAVLILGLIRDLQKVCQTNDWLFQDRAPFLA